MIARAVLERDVVILACAISAGIHAALVPSHQVVARLGHDWKADVAAYDRIHHHALGMADALSSGIVKQFPRRFR